MEPANEPIRVIRQTTNNLLRLNRQAHKDEITDLKRGIEDLRITPESLTDIIKRLKSKSSISLAELHILKNSLVDDAKNIELVLSTQSALRGLVREISGTDIKRQCAAAGCLCNLALGDAKACNAVVKAAGAYLVVALDNACEELAVTSAWAVGNAAGSGPAACVALSACGALPALVRRVCAPAAASDAAVYALTHLAYQMKDELSLEYVTKILEALSDIDLTRASAQLLFILSCHHQLPTKFPDQLLRKIFQVITVNMYKHVSACKESNECYMLAHLLRTLANICVTKEYCDIIMTSFVENNICLYFRPIFHCSNGIVRDSLLWLLANIYNICGESRLRYELG